MNQGELINKLIELRDQKRELEKQVSAIESQYNETKQELINVFKNDGTFSGKTAKGSATLTEKTLATASNIDAFWDYVLNARDPSLMSYARPNNKACQELLALGIDIPGITLITQQDISLRSS